MFNTDNQFDKVLILVYILKKPSNTMSDNVPIANMLSVIIGNNSSGEVPPESGLLYTMYFERYCLRIV